MEDEEETLILPSRRSRRKKTPHSKQSQEYREPSAHREPVSQFDDVKGDFDDFSDSREDMESGDDHYEDLAPQTEREYGPPRDVFADLIPEDEDSDLPQQRGYSKRQAVPRPVARQSFPGSVTVDSPLAASPLPTPPPSETPSKGRLTRGSKVRPADSNSDRNFALRRDVAEIDDDPFSGFSKKSTRGSRSDAPSHRSRASFDSNGEDDFSYEEDSFETERKRSKSRTSSRRFAEPDPMDERDEQEELEMMQLHKGIPGWDDAVLPVVEANIARHSQRRHYRKK